jgi:hypothetical protein
MGININTLRRAVSKWEYSETHFYWYSKIPKTELVKRILEKKDLKFGNEPTLGECILKVAYGI